MSIVSRVDCWQQRNIPVAFAIATVYKFAEDRGPYLAALITYYAFVSLFPLLLLLTTVLGVVLADHPGLQHQILHSALRQFPVIGDELGRPRGLSGGAVGFVVGITGALYGATGAGQAIQFAMDAVWSVPRNIRPNPFRARVRSLLLLSLLGSALIAITMMSALGRASVAFGVFGQAGVTAVALVVNTGIALVGFRVSTARDVAFRKLIPGAVAAAGTWQLVQWFGAIYVSHVVRSASVTRSVFAIVLGLVAFLYLIAVVLVLSGEINAVHARRLYPRALLTPFTDDVRLTEADRKVYAAKAKAQRAKGFQRIEVSFGDDSDSRAGADHRHR